MMDLHILVIFFIVLGCSSLEPENRGTDFYLALGYKTGNEHGVETTDYLVYISSEEENTISIEGIDGFIEEYDLSPRTTVMHNFTYDWVLNQAGNIESKGFRVYSSLDVPFSIIGFLHQPHNSDGFLGYPVNTLGTKYISLSYSAVYSGLPFVYIVGTENDTNVFISSPHMLSNGEKKRTVTLDRFQTLVEVGPIFKDDMTGTVISSDKPIAVFAGASCANVPANVGACNILIEQMPPVNMWDSTFLTAPFKTRLNGDIIRVLSSEDDNEISINGEVVEILNFGEFYEFESSTGNFINTSQPSLVAQYSKGYTADDVQNSDPFLVIIAPIAQFNTNYNVMSPDTTTEIIWDHYINIIIESGEEDGLELDEQAIVTTWVEIEGTDYVYATMTVDEGSHFIEHTDDVPFQITSYGYGDTDGYGYLGGSKLINRREIQDITANNNFRGVAAHCVYPPSATQKACFNLNQLFDIGSKEYESINCTVEDCNLDGSNCWSKKKKAKSSNCKFNQSKQNVCVELASCDVSYKLPCLRFYEITIGSNYGGEISSRIAIPTSARSIKYDRTDCSPKGTIIN